MHERGAVLAGFGLGVGLMYLLDPEHGRRRRALVRDRLTRASRGFHAWRAAEYPVEPTARLAQTPSEVAANLREAEGDQDLPS